VGIAPTTPIRPESWPAGPAAVPPGNPVPTATTGFGSINRLSDEEAFSLWLKPRGGIPETFTGTEVIARVGSQVILASEVLVGADEIIANALNSGQIREEQVVELRHYLMRQKLEQTIETKLVLVEALRDIPKENLPKVEQKVREIYEKEHLPKLIDGVKIKSRAELIEMMRKAGTSPEEQQRVFFERSLAAQYLMRQSDDEKKEITHEQMLAYYRAHQTEYETPPRARWEHIMVRASNYPSKAEAHAKIAEWGNMIFAGKPFADVAREHSDDHSSEQGGLHDWTTQGALAYEVLDKAIFTLPVGQLSAILEDERGFHIIRVVERQDLQRKPFGEMQAEIKKRIKEEREGEASKKYVTELRKKTPVWTIFDDLPPLEERAAERPANRR
jgi:parvulin-like peptidyl-prolyl isomerase